MAEPELAVVFSSREWANRIVRHITDHGGGRVRLRIVDGRVALEESFDILIAEDITSFLDARFLNEMVRRGRQVLGVYDPAEPAGKDGLLGLGVREVIECSATSEEFVRRVAAMAGSLREASLDGLEEPAGAQLASIHQAAADPQPRGMVLAVGAPPGGYGATELAIELARGGAARGRRSVLVDADDVAPAVAQRLGIELIPNLRSAVEAVFQGTLALPQTLSSGPGGELEVLPGLASGLDWSHLRAPEAAEVIKELALIRDEVIVNAGGMMEDLAAFGGPDRHGLTRAVVEVADAVLAVGAASPLGVTRLLAWVAEVRSLAPATPLHIVINEAPGSRFEREEAAGEISRIFHPASLHFVPFDPRVRKAVWGSRLVASGPFTKAVRRAGDAVLAGWADGTDGAQRAPGGGGEG